MACEPPDSAPIAKVLASACGWIAAIEAHAVAHGRPLDRIERAWAARAGVRAPDRVRVLVTPSMPRPEDPVLADLARDFGLITPATVGLSARYGVYVRSNWPDERRVLVHELVHTAQYERLGGIEAFLQQFAAEVQRAGLTGCALEREAARLALQICDDSPLLRHAAGAPERADGPGHGPRARAAGLPVKMGQLRFEDPGRLVDGELELALVRCRFSDASLGRIPSYAFEMRHAVSGMALGALVLRVGDGDTVLRYVGHVGYDVYPEQRGHRYAARSLVLIRPFATHLGLSPLWICCAPDNLASRRTCELAGCQLVEVAAVPPDQAAYGQGLRTACRYRLGAWPP